MRKERGERITGCRVCRARLVARGGDGFAARKAVAFDAVHVVNDEPNDWTAVQPDIAFGRELEAAVGEFADGRGSTITVR